MLRSILFVFILNGAVSANEICKVLVYLKKFNPEKHNFTYWKNTKTITKIDDKDYSGTDGSMPTNQINEIFISLNSTQYQIDKKAFQNLYNIYCPNNACILTCDSKSPVFFLTGGDGAGSYAVYYKFSDKNKWVERILREHPDATQPVVDYFKLLPKK